MMLSSTLINAFEGKQGGLTYKTDGGLFNTSRMKATTKFNTEKIVELLFADECALCAYN